MKLSLSLLFLIVLFAGVFFVQAQTEIKPGISGAVILPTSLNQYASTTLTIRANITSVYGIQSARFSIADPNGATVISGVNLYDDGRHGDGAANDEVFGFVFNYVYTHVPGTYYVAVEATAAYVGTKTVKTNAAFFTVTPSAWTGQGASPACQWLGTVINNNLGKSCQTPETFVSTADIDKDGFINESDSALYSANYSSPGWCEAKTYNITDSCQGFFSRDFTGSAWRFVSWPHQEGISLERIKQQCGSQAVIWNETENYASKMSPGKGYWFNIAKSCALGKSGAPYNNFSLNLQPNQCVGFGAPFSPVSLKDITGDCEPSQLWLFEWDTWYAPADGLRPGYGYSICNGNQTCALKQSACQQLVRQYEKSAGSVCTGPNYSPVVDYNNDGKIDFADLSLLQQIANKTVDESFCQTQFQKTNVCDKPVIASCAGLGDVNNDNLITSQDERIIRDYYPDPKIYLDQEAWQRADVNSDGNVNTADADLIKDFRQGKIDKFSGCQVDLLGSLGTLENIFIERESVPIKIYLEKKGASSIPIDGGKITVFDQSGSLPEKKIKEDGIAFEAGWQKKEIIFDWLPEGIGSHNLRLVIEYFQYPGDPPEINQENNQYTLSNLDVRPNPKLYLKIHLETEKKKYQPGEAIELDF